MNFCVGQAGSPFGQVVEREIKSVKNCAARGGNVGVACRGARARCRGRVQGKNSSGINVTIKSAEQVAAGEFAGPDKVKQVDLPAFCRVIASMKPTPGSDIGVEIWMPIGTMERCLPRQRQWRLWRLLIAGYRGMEEGLRRGYVTAVTDTGTAPASVLDGDPLDRAIRRNGRTGVSCRRTR